jgi:serine/arginine repetitive matrix protein 2
MYNGIGLATARGSGTNGYVQKNLAYRRENVTKNKYNYNDIARVGIQNTIFHK